LYIESLQALSMCYLCLECGWYIICARYYWLLYLCRTVSYEMGWVLYDMSL